MKKRYSGSGVSVCVKEKQGGGDLVGRGMEFRDGVGWTGFAGTEGEELGVGQVYLGRGAEGEGSAASTGESTCTPGLVAYNEDTGKCNGVHVSRSVCGRGLHVTYIVSVVSRGGETSRGRWPRVGRMRRSRQSRTRHPRLDSRSAWGIRRGRWSIADSNTPTRTIC